MPSMIRLAVAVAITVAGYDAAADSASPRTQLPASRPFSLAAGHGGAGIAGRVNRVVVDTEQLDRQTPFVAFDLPLSGNARVDLRLEPFRVTSEHTRFVIGEAGQPDRPLDFAPSRVRLFRGRVVDHPGSHVFLAVSPWGVNGHVRLAPGQSYALTSRTADGTDLPTGVFDVLAAPPVGGVSLPVAFCGLQVSAAAPPASPNPVGAGQANIRDLRHIELAVETDYELFQLFGDADAVAAYLVQMYAAVSDIYIREVNSHFTLSFVRIWDDPNDLFNQPDPLSAFRNHWNDEMDHVHRDVAQFFSGRRNLPYGGVAFLNGLCNSGAYSVTGYALGFFVDPSFPNIFNRDITIAAHELGHNCGTLHTHNYELDTCNDEESQPRRGTIMSYCGQTFTGGAANTDVGFHAHVQMIMEDYINSRSCIVYDCNQNGVDDQTDVLEQTSPDANANQIPDECEDCNGNGTLDDSDIANQSSADVNANGIPDECEPDCNANQIPDAMDLETGPPVAEDLNFNNVPDECEPDCDDDGVLDYVQIIDDMTLDLNRNAALDGCEDCDGDQVADIAALDHAHNIWVADLQAEHIREYFALVGAQTNVSQNGVTGGHDLIITDDRRILVTDQLQHRIAEFDVAGNYVGDFVATGVGGLAGAGAMAVTPRDTLLVTSRNNDSVIEYDMSGAPLGAFVQSAAGGLERPFGLAFGPNGNLFVTSDDNQVLEFDGGDGSFVRVFVTSADNGGLTEPRGMLFLPYTGNLLVASLATDQVLEFDGITGAFVRQFNQGGTTAQLTLDEPWCLRLGPEGDVYVSRSNIDFSAATAPESAAVLQSNDDPAGLHLTNARVYQFDRDLGFLVRAYILGVNSGLQFASGFDFVPDAGTDCNANVFPDNCDIAQGRSFDFNANGIPDECEHLGDGDADGDVDLFDFAAFNACFTGQGGGPVGPSCTFADFDADTDVDLRDAGAFFLSFTGD